MILNFPDNPQTGEQYVGNGIVYTYDGVKWVGRPDQQVVSTRGATGATGPTGTQGATGYQGATGPAGSQGQNGATGTPGPVGSTGSQGLQGQTGATGVQGTVGATGVQGLVGSTGIIGLSGATGIQGTVGATGVQGLVGSTGIIGLSGATGIQGTVGATGDQGIRGLTGAQGTSIRLLGTVTNFASLPLGPSIGDGYIAVDTGDIWFWGTNTQWYDAGHIVGPKGDPGVQGQRGLDGPQGATGIIGLTGATGANGLSGATGVQGLLGATGIIGLTGATGANGLSGATGVQGLLGATGVQGLLGATGSQGNIGATGSAGVDGATGVQGNIGATGVQGQPGSTWLSSTGLAPAPGTNPGDQYLDSDTGNVYAWDGETWIYTGNIKGPAGDSGSGSSGTVWTNDANGCLRAELSSTGFQAFTDATHLDLQDSGQWNIGSYQNSTFIGNDEFTNTNILSLRSGDETYITTSLRENGNHQWKFGADGTTKFPNNSTFNGADFIAAPGNYIELGSSNGQNWMGVDPTGAFIQTNFNNGNYTWAFNSTGTMTTPGSIIPDADIAYDLGSPDKQWRHIYVNTGSIYLGGIKLSTENNQLVVQEVTNIGGDEQVVTNYALQNADRLVKDGQTLVLTTNNGAAVVGVENTATDLIIGSIAQGLGIQSNGTTVLSSGQDTGAPLVLAGAYGMSQEQDGGDVLIIGGYSDSGLFGGVQIQGQYAEILTFDGLVIGNGDDNPWVFDNSDLGLVFPDDTRQYTAWQGSTIVSDTAPDNDLGRIWFNSTDGRAYVKYNDLWTDLSPQVIPSPETYLEGLTIEDTTIAKTTFNDGKSISIDNEGKAVVLKTTGELQVPGDVVPETTGTQKLGTTTKRWKEAHIDEIHTTLDGGGASTWLTAV